ncbi:DUF3618 domain-containing protein [Arthrobacter sp. PAMC25564]|uniref:DUF3618 domain-containing protein n=1 Tax=Arthrobacter sp. PAMC25564 TaxID=2565366 RepID=UPI0010A20329|nr:DUF3618 domain-containing protein [Arthrobacter sp. PAMC25564]QCB95771.1 DUF3618 domain-containing protein [Arthrobacter sp. PAMC25564]
MSENPDAIRADIEATRARLGTNVDAVADKVTPSHIVQRQTDKVKETVKDTVFGAKDKVMGTAGDAAGGAPRRLATKTQGNPLAAGLIAFGAGLLFSSLIPASEKERETADALKSAAEPLTTELAEAGKNVAEGLRGPAQESMENIKASAAEATETIKTEGQYAVGDVKETAASAADNIKQA